MSKAEKVLKPGAPESDAACGVAKAVRAALKDTLRLNARSAPAIAIDLSARLGRQVTPDIIYSWSAESNPNRFPLEYLPAWCQATGDYSVLHAVTDALGLPRPSQQHADLLAYGRHALQRDLTDAEMDVLKARILSAPNPSRDPAVRESGGFPGGSR